MTTSCVGSMSAGPRRLAREEKNAAWPCSWRAVNEVRDYHQSSHLSRSRRCLFLKRSRLLAYMRTRETNNVTIHRTKVFHCRPSLSPFDNHGGSLAITPPDEDVIVVWIALAVAYGQDGSSL